MKMNHHNKTQHDMVLEHLASGRPITPIEALNQYGVFRLAAIVHVLRNEGYDIVTDLIAGPRNKFARYSMA